MKEGKRWRGDRFGVNDDRSGHWEKQAGNPYCLVPGESSGHMARVLIG